MGTAAKLHLRGFGELIAENFLATRANKGVTRIGIHDENEVRETIDETPREFLLLVELALHLAARSDVHDGTLITNHLAGSVAHGRCGVQTNDGRAILAQAD